MVNSKVCPFSANNDHRIIKIKKIKRKTKHSKPTSIYRVTYNLNIDTFKTFKF